MKREPASCIFGRVEARHQSLPRWIGSLSTAGSPDIEMDVKT
jgi:hypothetical protein